MCAFDSLFRLDCLFDVARGPYYKQIQGPSTQFMAFLDDTLLRTIDYEQPAEQQIVTNTSPLDRCMEVISLGNLGLCLN